MYLCNFLYYERVIARLYSKKSVVNFICLNKEFVIVIVIDIVILYEDLIVLLHHDE